jgi:5-methylcytosine-specific restriction endonuclease McrA
MSNDTTPTKICSKCGIEKPATTEFFHRSKRTKDGLNTHCKACKASDTVRHSKARLERLSHIEPPTEPKACIVCGNVYPRTNEFWHKHKYTEDGFCSTCKKCAVSRAREWYAENGVQQEANRRERMEADPEYREKRLQGTRDSYHRYIEDRRRRSREYYAENRERVRNEYWPKHYAKNRQGFIDRAAQWREDNPERYKTGNKVYKARRRKREMDAPGSHTAEDIRNTYDEQEGRCAYCGITLHGEFHLDHVEPLVRGGSNDPDNLACACSDCNLSKGDKLLAEWIAWREW